LRDGRRFPCSGLDAIYNGDQARWSPDWAPSAIQLPVETKVAPTGSRHLQTDSENRAEGGRLADVVEAHIRWRLWHGQVQRALDLIGDTLGPLEAMANDAASPAALQAGKVAKVLRGLETETVENVGVIMLLSETDAGEHHSVAA
jgi:hypothetical protein